jgi:transposase
MLQRDGRDESEAQAFTLTAPEAGGGSPPAKQADTGGRGRRYKQGPPRGQSMLLPPSVEDYVGEDNLVRAIAAYVDSLDLAALSFTHAAGGLGAGQPAYDPTDLLKLYLYGYLNRARSSRRLEAECRRNLEVIWLLNGLVPSYHTIADFRKNNAEALRRTNREFVLLCRELRLIGGHTLGIDGSFFNADASDASVKTKAQLEAELAAIERDIDRWHALLNDADAEAAAAACERATPEQIDALKARAERRCKQLKQLEEAGETQRSRTDPDARRLRKNGQKVTGYNVQSVVDSEHKLIVAHAVTNAGNDLGQLIPMIEQAEAVLDDEAEPGGEPTADDATAQREVLADAGYYTEADIAACQARGTTVYVPPPEPRGNSAERNARLSSAEFRYDAEQDCYHCPGGQTLSPVGKPVNRNGTARQRYRSKATACATCTLRAQCLSANATRREIERSEHAEAAARHRAHMQDSAAKMRERAALCEHPFGTLKRWLGWDHFLVRGFDKVGGEMALLVQCYNLRRLLSIVGIDEFIALCRQRQQDRQAAAEARRLCAPFWHALRRLQHASGALWRRAGLCPAAVCRGWRASRALLRAA